MLCICLFVTYMKTCPFAKPSHHRGERVGILNLQTRQSWMISFLSSEIFTAEEKLPELNVGPTVGIHAVRKKIYSCPYENPTQAIRVEVRNQ